jgi:hypothetical protein
MPSIHAAQPDLNVVPRFAAVELDEQRLNRLRELRAVIDALRQEKESRDPLLAWVLEDNHSRNTRRD